MRHSRPLGRLLIVGLIVALLAAVPGAAAAKSQEPFRLAVSTTDTLVTPLCPSICLTSTGTGSAGRLGDFTSRGLIIATSIHFLPGFRLELTTYETYVFTATDGSRLRLTNLATGIEDLTSGQSSITGHWFITGGTGRFSDATGSGTTSGTLQAGSGLLTLNVSAVFVGTISVAGSLK